MTLTNAQWQEALVQLANTGLVATLDTTDSNFLSVLAGAISASLEQTNVSKVGGTAVSVNSGTVDAGTQRMTLATDVKVPVKAASGDFATGAIADLPVKGQAAMSASVPIAIASDQSAVPVKRSAVAAYSLASVTTSGSTQNSGDITVGPYTEIALDINTTAQAGTSPTIQYFYERKGADGLYYVLWQSAVLTAATNTVSTSIGAGMAYNQSLGSTGRLRWVIGGSSTPTFTHSANITGK